MPTSTKAYINKNIYVHNNEAQQIIGTIKQSLHIPFCRLSCKINDFLRLVGYGIEDIGFVYVKWY